MFNSKKRKPTYTLRVWPDGDSDDTHTIESHSLCELTEHASGFFWHYMHEMKMEVYIMIFKWDYTKSESTHVLFIKTPKGY